MRVWSRFSCLHRPRSLITALWVFVAAPATAAEAPRLQPGAIEIGLGGSLTSVEGNTRSSIGILGSTFLGLGPGLVGVGADLTYTHVSSLDVLDLEGHVGWQWPVSSTSLYPILGVGGGIRQEWVGSFRTTRYPVGIDLGLRALVSSGAAVRVEYRLRRVLGDPVSDFTEHRALFGVSLLLENTPEP